ncbi:MAG: hypothetical protein U5N86_03430 [Planctomycetota bacterium]|nr:hypothetical protein [Planctomycetota bacterium]
MPVEIGERIVVIAGDIAKAYGDQDKEKLVFYQNEVEKWPQPKLNIYEQYTEFKKYKSTPSMLLRRGKRLLADIEKELGTIIDFEDTKKLNSIAKKLASKEYIDTIYITGDKEKTRQASKPLHGLPQAFLRIQGCKGKLLPCKQGYK